MLVYLLLIFISVLLIIFQNSTIYKIENTRRILFYLLTFCLFLLMILRSSNVGTDYLAYNGYFYSTSFALKSQYIENGYILLNEVAQELGIFLIIPAFEFIISYFGMYKLSTVFKTNSFAFLGFYILTYVYMQSFNALRQFIAIGFICFGCVFLFSQKRSRYLLFIFFIFLAYEFHSSSLIMIFLPLLSRIRVTKSITFMMMVLTSVLFFTGWGFKITQPLIGLNSHYATKYGGDTGFLISTGSKGLVQFIPVLIQFIMLIMYLYIQENNSINLDKNHTLLSKKNNFIFSGYLIFLMLYAAGGNGVVDRIQFFFFPIVIIANILFYDSRSYLDFKMFIYRSVLLAFWVLYCILRLVMNNAGVVPYSFK